MEVDVQKNAVSQSKHFLLRHFVTLFRLEKSSSIPRTNRVLDGFKPMDGLLDHLEPNLRAIAAKDMKLWFDHSRGERSQDAELDDLRNPV